MRRDSVHRDGHDTEYDAAESSAARATVIRRRVLKVLDAHPVGLTDDEGAALLKLPDRLDFGRRRNELVTDGLVYKTDLRRSTPRGHPAIVWRLTKFHDVEFRLVSK